MLIHEKGTKHTESQFPAFHSIKTENPILGTRHVRVTKLMHAKLMRYYRPGVRKLYP